jgi:hypothetical protein
MTHDERAHARWAAEFAELGSARVRSEVMLGRYPPDKRRAARAWLERHDVAAWQSRASPEKGGLGRFRGNRRLWAIVSGLIFGAFALFGLLRQLKGF